MTYVSKKRIAEILGVSPRTVDSWRQLGLPVIKIGNVCKFSVENCTVWFDSFEERKIKND